MMFQVMWQGVIGRDPDRILNRFESAVFSALLLLTYIWVFVAWSHGGDLVTRHFPHWVCVAWFLAAGACCALLALRVSRLEDLTNNPLFGIWDDAARRSAKVRTILAHRTARR
jgi:hypothetical protein